MDKRQLQKSRLERNRHLHGSTEKGGGEVLALLCRIVGLVLILGVIAVLLPAVLPPLLGQQVYTIVSGSMEPAIPVGSLVVVKPEEAAQIETDEVVAFASGQSVITHRVVRNSAVEGQLVTKGDANEAEDLTPVSYDQVLGVVTHSYPRVGQMLSFALSGAGRLALFGLLVCGLLFEVLAGRLRGSGQEA